MRFITGVSWLFTAGSLAAVGCRVDYDEMALALRAAGGTEAQSGASSSGRGGDAGSLGGEAGSGGSAPSGGTSGVAGSGSAGVSGSGGSGTSGGTSGVAGSGSAGVSGSGGSGTSGGAAGAGGTNAGSSSQGGAGSGGTAGGPSLPDCVTAGFNGKTYLMCAPELTWVAARDECASVGMELARADDAAENQWLFDNAYDLDVPSDGLWIGGSDAAVEGEWRWPDGTLFWLGDSNGTGQGGLYTNFYANHPGGNSLNDCLVIDLGIDTMPGWYSDRCNAGTNVFACESL
jgi:hypothetical protein